MSKYTVGAYYDAVQWIEVEADSQDQAIAKAMKKAGPYLCHECSDGLDVGEYLGCQVLDKDGELLYTDLPNV